jgi:hypothetical protein
MVNQEILGPSPRKPGKRSLGTVIPFGIGFSNLDAAVSDQDLLRGFKLNTFSSSEPAMRGQVFDPTCDAAQIITVPKVKQSTKMTLVSDSKDTNEAMEIEGKLSVAYGPMISGEGAGSFMKKFASSRKEVKFVYRSRRTAFARRPQGPINMLRPSDYVLNLQTDFDTIYGNYGTFFINQIIYGAQIEIVYTISSESVMDQQEIEAELQGSVGVGVLSVDFEARFDQKKTSEEKRLKMSIEYNILGAEVDGDASGVIDGETIGAQGAFGTMFDIINQFQADYKKRRILTCQNCGMSKEDCGADNEVETANVAENLAEEAKDCIVLPYVGGGLSPIAMSLETLSNAELRPPDGFTAVIIADKMTQLSKTIADVYFQEEILRREQAKVNTANPRGKLRRENYYPWLKAKDNMFVRIGDIMKNVSDFRRLAISELLDATVPKKPTDSYDLLYKIDGLLGNGFVYPPVKFGDKEFPDMYWEGYTIVEESQNGDLSERPLYRGSLICENETFNITGIVQDIKDTRPDICTPTAKPVPNPTPKPVPPPTPKPAPYPTRQPAPYPSRPIGVQPVCGPWEVCF